jgi:hypothetical protein
LGRIPTVTWIVVYDLGRLIKKSSTFFPFFIAATNHLGFAPLPAQVSPLADRYFGGTFLPLSDELIRIALRLG